MDTLRKPKGDGESSPRSQPRAQTAPPAKASMQPHPHIDDLTGPSWRPPPRKDEARATSSAEFIRPFRKDMTIAGGFLNEQTTVRAEPMEIWPQQRIALPSRGHPWSKHLRTRRGHPHLNEVPVTYPSQKGYRWHVHSEPLGDISDDMCHPMHRQWLKDFSVTRDKELYPVYHAMNRLERAQDIKREHDKRNQQARDIAMRKNLCPPKVSDDTARMDDTKRPRVGLKDEEVADRVRAERVERAKSAPALQIQPPKEAQIRHLRGWRGPQRNIPYMLKESTPWREQDEQRKMVTAERAKKNTQDKK